MKLFCEFFLDWVNKFMKNFAKKALKKDLERENLEEISRVFQETWQDIF